MGVAVGGGVVVGRGGFVFVGVAAGWVGIAVHAPRNRSVIASLVGIRFKDPSGDISELGICCLLYNRKAPS